MMSYDPSSLNRNKTLLEAIEEVKKFLIANPCYKVFYANTSYLVGTTTYSKTYIDDPDSIAEYDVVFFDNNYYGKVESVGDSTFTIIGATNFKGDTGAQGTPGTPGTPGANGVSITNVSIDASNHLICTLSDGTSIDAGEIAGSTDHTITLLSASGVLTNEQYAELGYDNSIIKYSINSVPYFFRKESEDVSQIVFRSIRPHSTNTRIPDIIITKAGQGYQYYDSSINVDGIAVSSSGASAGQVLTADGDGFSSWQTPSGASFDNYVEINTTSGTFTNDEYAKLVFNDSVIVYDNSTYKTIYKKKIETSSIIEFESIDASARQNLKLIDVNKGTKAFSSTGISMITSSTFDSGAATSGKVLTANGSGGTSWETSSGGITLNQYAYNMTGTNFTRLQHIVKNAKGNVSIGCIYTYNGKNYYGSINYGFGWLSNQEMPYLNLSGILLDMDNRSNKYIIIGADTGNNLYLLNYFDGTTITASIITSGITLRVNYWNDTEITS